MPIWALCTEWSHGTKTPCKRANNTVGPWKERIFLTDVIYLFFLPNSTACHPSRGIVVPSDRFFQGLITIHKKKLTWAIFYQIFRGGSRIFFRRGGTRLLLYFNTNKPHSFFFGRIPVVLENRRSSQGGGVRTPCTLPLDPPLIFESVIIMPSNLKKTYTMKKRTATIFTQKSANFELAPLQNKHNTWEQNILSALTDFWC